MVVPGKSIAPFVPGVAQYLDQAIEMAAATNIRVIICLHAAPGSQNGFEHSAPRDRFNFRLEKCPDVNLGYWVLSSIFRHLSLSWQSNAF